MSNDDPFFSAGRQGSWAEAGARSIALVAHADNTRHARTNADWRPTRNHNAKSVPLDKHVEKLFIPVAYLTGDAYHLTDSSIARH